MENVCLNNFIILIFNDFLLIFPIMADVIAMWRADVIALYIDFPLMADVIAMWRADVIALCLLFQIGRCCANWPWDVIMFLFQMADVIAMIWLYGWCYYHILWDVKPLTFCGWSYYHLAFFGWCYCQCVIMWQMLLPLGRCYSHVGGGLAGV